MSVLHLNKALDLITKNFSADEMLKSGSKSDDSISKLENILQVKFPLSYKRFLKDIGFGGPNSLIVSGLRSEDSQEMIKTGIAYTILKHRKEFDLPNHIILLSDIGDGSYYALDLSQMNDNNECPVVIWPLNGYEDTPVLEIAAPDFGIWFLEQVEEQIKLKNENNII